MNEERKIEIEEVRRRRGARPRRASRRPEAFERKRDYLEGLPARRSAEPAAEPGGGRFAPGRTAAPTCTKR